MPIAYARLGVKDKRTYAEHDADHWQARHPGHATRINSARVHSLADTRAGTTKGDIPSVRRRHPSTITARGHGFAFSQSMDFCRSWIAYTGLCTPIDISLLM